MSHGPGLAIRIPGAGEPYLMSTRQIALFVYKLSTNSCAHSYPYFDMVTYTQIHSSTRYSGILGEH